MYRIYFSIIVIAGLLSYAYYKGKREAQRECIIKNQQQQIEVQNEIDKSKKEVETRFKTNIVIPVSDDLLFLQESFCEDCK